MKNENWNPDFSIGELDCRLNWPSPWPLLCGCQPSNRMPRRVLIDRYTGRVVHLFCWRTMIEDIRVYLKWRNQWEERWRETVEKTRGW